MENCLHPKEYVERIDNAAFQCRQCKAIKRLYAVAFNYFSKKTKQWEPAPLEYTHAWSAAEAKAIIIRGRRVRIDVFAVGEAVGFFVNDKHGEDLSAS